MSATLLSAVALAACSSGTTPAGPGSTSSSTSSAATSPAGTTSPAGPYATLGSLLPLYPFATLTDVHAWQDSYTADGHQPWHLDAGQTALAFTAWLGLTNVDAVVATKADAAGEHVSLGFHPTPTNTVTSAVVHLVRWGTGSHVPWEVVGTDDTTFSLTAPAYGSAVTSPLRVGGTISGVDESITVEVHELHATGPVGSYCCLASGGEKTPWQAPVSFTAAPGTVLTVVARTGGHVAAVERFAVTGVRSR